MKTLVFAPTWLGDAVMALPAIADIRRHIGATASLAVAARPGVADLFRLLPHIDEVVALSGEPGLSTLRRAAADVRSVKGAGADVALLLPNAFQAALVARRAGVPDRWGYRRDLRGWLLTRAVACPAGLHQVDYYRHLVRALGMENGPREPRLEAPDATVAAARRLLQDAGWDLTTRLVGVAPGAAFGGAKRWPPERFAQVILDLARTHRLAAVLVGSGADRPSAWAIERELDKIGSAGPKARLINVVGRTDLAQLVGVTSLCAAFVSNDSGAMHIAAALGVPLVASFGPTNEHETAPVAAKARVLCAAVWCRPCGLRECPLDHRCMTGITADDVVRAMGAWL